MTDTLTPVDTPEFKRWFGDSVVTVDGKPGSEPLIVYHGSEAPNIEAFELGDGALGVGVYFETELAGSQTYGSFVYRAYVRVENPYVMQKEDYKSDRKLLTRKLKRAGYDGIIRTWSASKDYHILVFSPEQIKAVDNKGSWNPDDPRIREASTIRGTKLSMENPVKNISDYKIYHDTFTSAIDEVITCLQEQGYYLDSQDVWHQISTGAGKPKNGLTNRYNMALYTKEGTPAKRGVAFQIADLGRRYELNLYLTPMREKEYATDQVEPWFHDNEDKPMREALREAEEKLKATYGRNKDYYGKAHTRDDEEDDKTIILKSYSTDVAEVKGDLLYVYGWYSATTCRHINDFAHQNGFRTFSKKDIDKGTTVWNRDGEEVSGEVLREGEKRYNTMQNVGKAKYVTNYHRGDEAGERAKHKDGSDFFDIHLTGNKRDHEKFIKELEKEGYRHVREGRRMKESGVTFNGKNFSEIEEILGGAGIVNKSPSGKCTIHTDKEDIDVFKDDVVTVRGGQVTVGKPSYVSGKMREGNRLSLHENSDVSTEFHGYEIYSKFYGDKAWSASSRNTNYNNHRITVVNIKTGKKITFEYWQSIAKVRIKTVDDLITAFGCLVMDAQYGDLSFKDFCSELGYECYDAETKKESMKVYKGCQKQYAKALELGIDLADMYNLLSDGGYV